MTSLDFHTGLPNIEPWVRGWIENDPPQTEIVWRTYLSVQAGREGKIGATKQEIEAFFEAAAAYRRLSLQSKRRRTQCVDQPPALPP